MTEPVRISFFGSNVRVRLVKASLLERMKAPSTTSTARTSERFSALALPTTKSTRTWCASAGTLIHVHLSASRRGALPLRTPSSRNGPGALEPAPAAARLQARLMLRFPTTIAPSTIGNVRPWLRRIVTISLSRQPSPQRALTFRRRMRSAHDRRGLAGFAVVASRAGTPFGRPTVGWPDSGSRLPTIGIS